MTDTEKYLTYIYKDIVNIVRTKDSYLRCPQLDKVIKDCCKIPYYSTRVLGSKSPLAFIYRSVESGYGEMILKFFNVGLYECRRDLVDLLVECEYLCAFDSNKSRKKYYQLKEHYKKSVKKIQKILFQIKGKSPYKLVYGDFTAYPKFKEIYNSATIVDDYADDEYFNQLEENFTNDDEIEDFIEDDVKLNQINNKREGQNDEINNFKLTSQMLDTIIGIEHQIGRKLTETEISSIIEVLSNDEDEDDENDIQSNLIDQNSQHINDDYLNDYLEKMRSLEEPDNAEIEKPENNEQNSPLPIPEPFQEEVKSGENPTNTAETESDDLVKLVDEYNKTHSNSYNENHN